MHAATRESDDDTVGRCGPLLGAHGGGYGGYGGYGRYVECGGEVSRVEPGQQKRILGCIGLEEPAEEHLWGEVEAPS